MINRSLIYLAAFGAGVSTWMAFAILEAANPFLPWQYPVLIVFTGMSFPSGAPSVLHYANHVLETWFPFLIAYLFAYALSRKWARFSGALLLYGVFLGWSCVMVILAAKGVPVEHVFYIGLAGTFIGGAVFYVRVVDP